MTPIARGLLFGGLSNFGTTPGGGARAGPFGSIVNNGASTGLNRHTRAEEILMVYKCREDFHGMFLHLTDIPSQLRSSGAWGQRLWRRNIDRVCMARRKLGRCQLWARHLLAGIRFLIWSFFRFHAGIVHCCNDTGNGASKIRRWPQDAESGTNARH